MSKNLSTWFMNDPFIYKKVFSVIMKSSLEQCVLKQQQTLSTLQLTFVSEMLRPRGSILNFITRM